MKWANPKEDLPIIAVVVDSLDMSFPNLVTHQKTWGRGLLKLLCWFWLSSSGWDLESVFLSVSKIISMQLVCKPNHCSKWPLEEDIMGGIQALGGRLGGHSISLNICSGHFRTWNFCPVTNVLLKTFSNIQNSWKNFTVNTHIPTT